MTYATLHNKFSSFRGNHEAWGVFLWTASGILLTLIFTLLSITVYGALFIMN